MTKRILYLILLLLPFLGNAQNVNLLNNLRDSIRSNAQKMVEDVGEQQKKLYSDRMGDLVTQFISQEKSIDFNMDSLKLVKVLTSDNKYIRIFTWVVPLGNSKYLYKGIVQSYVATNKSYRTILLEDWTSHLPRPENKTLAPNKWFGAYYYKLIQTKRGSKYFYTLLGWKGVSKTKQSKVIEVITTKRNGEIAFGYSLFKINDYQYFEATHSVKRLVYTYSAQGSMYLDYDYQTILIKTNKRRKRSKRRSKSNIGFGAQQKLDQPKEKVKTIRDNMIVMDRLEPSSPEVADFYDFYFPESNIIDALRYEKNAWRYYPDIDARNEANPNDKKTKKVEYDLTPKE